MESTPRLGLDIDGVVADFYTAYYKWFDLPYIKYPRWENPYIKEHFDDIAKLSAFWEGVPPLISAEELDFPFEVWITNRSIHNDITTKWLESHGLRKGRPVVTVEGTKVQAALDYSLTDFIDDRPKNILELEEVGIKGWINHDYANAYFNHPRRLRGLGEVKSKIFNAEHIDSGVR